MGLMKCRSIFRKEAHVSAFLILVSNLFHSFIAFRKKGFLKDTVRRMANKYNLYLAITIEKEELDYKDMEVALCLQFCADNITASTIFYLLKI